MALYGSRVLEVYEPYPNTIAGQAHVRAVAGDWPGLVAVGVGLLEPVTPLARKLLRLAAASAVRP